MKPQKETWTSDWEKQLVELQLLHKTTGATILYLNAAKKAQCTPQQLCDAIAKHNKWQDGRLQRATDFVKENGGTVKPYPKHADGIVYAWDMTIPLASKYKLLIEIDRTDDVTYWDDPLFMRARVYKGARKANDLYGIMLTQGMHPLENKASLTAIFKSAHAIVRRLTATK